MLVSKTWPETWPSAVKLALRLTESEAGVTSKGRRAGALISGAGNPVLEKLAV